MKPEKASKKEKAMKQSQKPDALRSRTEVPGQNPKQNDAPDQDLYHDDNRPNLAK